MVPKSHQSNIFSSLLRHKYRIKIQNLQVSRFYPQSNIHTWRKISVFSFRMEGLGLLQLVVVTFGFSLLGNIKFGLF